MSKRVGVVTYWGIYNIGSYLQTFALQKVLMRLGYEPCVLMCKKEDRLSIVKRKIRLIIKLITHPSSIHSFLELRRMGLSSISVIPEITKRKFVEDEADVRVVSTSEAELRKESNDYFAFICGSDQIWNPLGFEFRGYKFLKFAPRHKRIAYAPSFGIDYIPSYNIADVKNGIKGMSSISVREPQGAKIVEDLTGNKCPIVLDPTLLLGGEEWLSYEKQINELPERYSLCFFLNAPSAETVKSIQRLSQSVPILCFPDIYGFSIEPRASKVRIGPKEFIYAIRNAETVFTDSFHGTAFSIIFNKRFVVFKRAHKDTYNQFNRIENILELSGKTAAICNNEPDYQICNSNVDMQALYHKVEYSINYLKNALNNVKANE